MARRAKNDSGVVRCASRSLFRLRLRHAPDAPHHRPPTIVSIMTENSPDVPPTVLSALQAKATSIPDDIAAASLHPFSTSSEKTVALLQALLDTTEQLAHSIAQHSNTVVNDSRTVSLLRQQSAGQHTLHLVRPKPTSIHPPFSVPSLCCPLGSAQDSYDPTRGSTRPFSHLVSHTSGANYGCRRGAPTRRHGPRV